MKNENVYPYNCIAYMEMAFTGGKTYCGTGFFARARVGKGEVPMFVTAAHNVQVTDMEGRMQTATDVTLYMSQE